MLLLTLFFRHFPKLIERGHVYVAKPPLFRVDAPARGKKPAAKIYALDEGELHATLDKLKKEGARENAWSISRFKGLGEMNAEQLWDTTLNPETRRLLQVELRRARVRRDGRLAHQADGQGRGAGAPRPDGAARRRGRGRRVSVTMGAAHSTAVAIRLRPTMLSDLDFVISVEQDPANRPFITPWDRTQHEGAIRFPDFRHFIVEAGSGYPSAGFVILQGCRNPHRSIELKRLVLQPALHGPAAPALRLLARWRSAISARIASGST